MVDFNNVRRLTTESGKIITSITDDNDDVLWSEKLIPFITINGTELSPATQYGTPFIRFSSDSFIDWGDGTFDLYNNNTASLVHDFSEQGTYNVRIWKNTVSAIGSSCFRECEELISVNIPDGVTTLGDNCFRLCKNLNNVTIPDTVTRIENSSFSDCINLTSIILPPNLTSIGTSCFAACSGLTNITIPKTVTTIASYAFLSCNNLSTITFERTTPPSFGSYTFNYVTATAYVPSGTKNAYTTALNNTHGNFTVIERE